MLLLTKAIFAAMIGLLASAVLGLFIIPVLKKFRLGQRISVFVGETHRKKEGTPTRCVSDLFFLYQQLPLH